MTIVAVNGGGNTPQGETHSGDAFDFSQLKTAPAGEAEHGPSHQGWGHWEQNLRFLGDDDAADFVAVDPNNPNADLLATPGPDDDLELPAVQKVGAFRDGLSLPDLSLPAVQDDGLLTTEPTAPEAGTGKDWIIVESYQFADNVGTDGKGYVLTSIQHSTTDTSLIDQSGTEASSRLFVGNLTLDSQASVQTGFVGALRVASGDVNGGDAEPEKLTGYSGIDWTLDFQPELTTEPTTSEGHAGTLNVCMGDGSVRGSNDSIWIDMGAPSADAGYYGSSSFQIISAGKTTEPTASETYSMLRLASDVNIDGPKGNWIADVTYESVEVLGQPTETIWMTYGHIEY